MPSSNADRVLDLWTDVASSRPRPTTAPRRTPTRPSDATKQWLALIAVVALLGVGFAVWRTTSPQPGIVDPSPTPRTTSDLTAAPTPSPTPTPIPVLHPNGLATIAVPGGVTLWATNTSSPKAAQKGSLTSGSSVFLWQGPVTVGGVDWWEVQTADDQYRMSGSGWIREIDASGSLAIRPYAPDCLPADTALAGLDVASRGALMAIACFGNATLNVEGPLECTSGIDEGGVEGPTWLRVEGHAWIGCNIGGLEVLGPAVTSLVDPEIDPEPSLGRYRVQGHFDDVQSDSCWDHGFGVTGNEPFEPDPDSIKYCRGRFVSDSAVPLDGQTPRPTIEPTPSPSLSPLARSDVFWDETVAEGPGIPTFGDLDEGVRDAELIVVGHVIEIGRIPPPVVDPEGIEHPGSRTFYVTLAIDEVLSGQPATVTPGTLQLHLITGDPRTKTPEFMPQHRHLFFLRNLGTLAEENHQTPALIESLRFSYMVFGVGGVIRDIDGVARALRDVRDYQSSFPMQFDGWPFDEVVQQVRDRIAGSL